MRTTARAIIIKDNALLVMYREKAGRQYYSLVGGGLEIDEPPEAAVYREVFEETGVTIAHHRLVATFDNGKTYGYHYIYVCDYVRGEPKLQPDSIEAKVNQPGTNFFRPEWLPLSQLAQAEFIQLPLKHFILHCLEVGFPKTPVHLTLPS